MPKLRDLRTCRMPLNRIDLDRKEEQQLKPTDLPRPRWFETLKPSEGWVACSNKKPSAAPNVKEIANGSASRKVRPHGCDDKALGR